MYNFTIPTQLKAWIDRIAVAGQTFREWMDAAGGAKAIAEGLKDLDIFPTPEENPDFYVDYDETGPYEAVTGADAVVLVTEWDAFRALDLSRIERLLNSPVLVDLRNVYDPAEVRAFGLTYDSVGRI